MATNNRGSAPDTRTQDKVGRNPYAGSRELALARYPVLVEALEWMLAPEQDWENGEVGVGYKFREKAREALKWRPHDHR